MLIDDTGAKRIAWIEALSICENPTATPRILDTNNRYSYGKLMFQKTTFDMYGEKYGLPHDDIYSDEQQELIALNMLNDGLWRHWRTCAKKTTQKLGPYPTTST